MNRSHIGDILKHRFAVVAHRAVRNHIARNGNIENSLTGQSLEVLAITEKHQKQSCELASQLAGCVANTSGDFRDALICPSVPVAHFEVKPMTANNVGIAMWQYSVCLKHHATTSVSITDFNLSKLK